MCQLGNGRIKYGSGISMKTARDLILSSGGKPFPPMPNVFVYPISLTEDQSDYLSSKFVRDEPYSPLARYAKYFQSVAVVYLFEDEIVVDGDINIVEPYGEGLMSQYAFCIDRMTKEQNEIFTNLAEGLRTKIGA